jgi:copper resistance protein B
MNKKSKWLLLAIAAAGVGPTLAQTTNSMPGHNMPEAATAAPIEKKPESMVPMVMPDMKGMDHSKMGQGTPAESAGEMKGMNHGGASMPMEGMKGMDHSKMGQGTPAESAGAMKGMNHGGASMPMEEMKGMDHSKMGQGTPAESAGTMKGMNHGGASAEKTSSGDMGAMDHGDMQMQGGSAPADARDPHAYSGGYTLEDGPYALPGPRQLRLADEYNFASVMFNTLEHGLSKGDGTTAYDAQAWFGRDYNRFVLKAEGEVANGKIEDSRTEALWSRSIATHWDAQAGARIDNGTGPDRGWLAFGVQGLAPYWFEVDAAAYVGNGGRTALRLGAEYELLLTQRLILQPSAEVNIYGKDDLARGIGRGFSNASAGLRLRYEISRQFAPYIGVERSALFGKTADIARSEGASTGDTRWVAGVRFWF